MPLGLNHPCRSGACKHDSLTDCFDELCRYVDELEERGVDRRSRIKALQDTLRAAEWSGGDAVCHPSGAWMGTCPDCSLLERDGHAVHCKLAATLNAKGAS